jgi:hypothetical protein
MKVRRAKYGPWTGLDMKIFEMGCIVLLNHLKKNLKLKVSTSKHSYAYQFITEVIEH